MTEISIMSRILSVRKDWRIKNRHKPQYLALRDTEHKVLINEIEEKFNSPWNSVGFFNETVEKLSQHIFGMDIIPRELAESQPIGTYICLD